MKHLLVVMAFSCLIAFFSCKTPECSCLGPQNDVIIQYVDRNEKPIFDSLDPAYLHNNLIFYYIIDDKEVKFTDVKNLEKNYSPATYGYDIIAEGVIHLYLNTSLKNKKSRSIIEYNNQWRDTIDATFVVKDSTFTANNDWILKDHIQINKVSYPVYDGVIKIAK